MDNIIRVVLGISLMAVVTIACIVIGWMNRKVPGSIELGCILVVIIIAAWFLGAILLQGYFPF